ncbi:MAG: hypothetical protein ABIZ04_21070 [Opitutus sp.]
MSFARSRLFSSLQSIRCRGLAARARHLAVPGLAMAAAFLFTACATGDYAYVITISSGERIHIPLDKGSPVQSSKGPYTVAHAALIPNTAEDKKEGVYLFALYVKTPQPPKSIRVEDVTDEHAVIMVDEVDPKIENQRWSAKSKPYIAANPELAWVTHLDNSMRVFRFTIVAQDGTKTVLDQGWMVPGWAKVGMRRTLGVEIK